MSLRLGLLLSIILFSCIGVLFVDPIPQWPEYHQFADQRRFLGIDNFFNVISNLFYIVLGIYCLISYLQRVQQISAKHTSIAPALFFVGLIFTGIGSSIYHLNPGNDTLFWDRLPMTVSFMSLFAYVIFSCISPKVGKKALLPLLVAGALSVLYWGYTESIGRGDLRFYALIQFLPMLIIPLLLLMFGTNNPERRYLWWVVIVYAFSKVAEMTDELLLTYLSVSGHTLKHIISSFTAVALLKAVSLRHIQLK